MSTLTSATDQGSRPYQEDRLVIKRVEAATPIGILLAVADGHGGDETSSYVEQQLSAGLFDNLLAKTNSPMTALKKTFLFINHSTLEISKSTGAHSESGTTLSLVYIPDSGASAYVGIIGDSPVVLVRENGSIHMSPEHNARSNKKERKSAEIRGGKFIDGYIQSHKDSLIGLQMTRDLGFHAMGKILGRYPDIYKLGIKKGDVLVVCSDGLLDPSHISSEAEAKRMAKLVWQGASAKELIFDALGRKTLDNVTAVVYRR
jgi:serine/threonine protein phosphatase PrpC